MTITTNQYHVSKRAIALLMGLILLAAGSRLEAQSYTLAPPPFLYVWATSGAIVPNGCVWTYAAGTTTPIATYSDSSGTLNANPIIADNFGRFVAYLLPGTNYKFTYEATACSAISHGSTIKTQDNIQGSPASAANVDIVGTAGEAISAGQVVYLSDGSGGKTQGQWYKADSANTYSALTPQIGIAPNAISSATTGTIRLSGYLTGLTSLIAGTPYFVGSSGALTSTPPTFRRIVGTADTTSSLVFAPWQIQTPPIANTLAGGSLTLTTGTPCSDATGASTVYYTPTTGNVIGLYDGTATWIPRTFAELSLALSGLVAFQGYDLFAYDNAGAVAVEAAEWANATVTMTIAAPTVITWTAHGMSTGQSITFTTTGALPTGVSANTQYWITVVDANTFKISTSLANVAAGTFINGTVSQSGVHTGHQPQARQTAVTRLNGVWVKSGASTRRLLGSFLTTATTTTEDSVSKRFLSNVDNRCQKSMVVVDTADNWTYNVDVYRQMDALDANKLAVFVAIADRVIDVASSTNVSNSAGGVASSIAIGEDSTTTPIANSIWQVSEGAAGIRVSIMAAARKQPTVGYHAYLSLERSTVTITTTFFGDNGGTRMQAGITGLILN